KLHLVGLGQSLVVIDVAFLVVGLPSIVSACLGFQDRLEDGSTVVYGLKLKLWFLGGWLPFSFTQSFVVLRWHERLVCACLVYELQTFIELVLLCLINT
ncbi:hypothetical protein HID58_037718, partial [Brassica napus]